METEKGKVSMLIIYKWFENQADVPPPYDIHFFLPHTFMKPNIRTYLWQVNRKTPRKLQKISFHLGCRESSANSKRQKAMVLASLKI